MSQIWFPAPDPALAALHDVFTYLCDCALARAPRAWRWHNPDRYRLRALRQLAQAAGLVSMSAIRGTLIPTPLAAHWLYQSPDEQLAVLAEAWVEQADSANRRQCLRRANEAGPDARLTPEQLTNRLSRDKQQRLWQPLVWLGYLIPEPDETQPTLFKVATLPTSSTHFPDWQIEQTTIVVPPPYYWPDLWDLEHLAQLVAIGPPRRYQLSSKQWGRAVARGLTAATAFSVLERGTGSPLPAPLRKHFAPAIPEVMVQPGALFTFTQPEALQKLRQRFVWRRRFTYLLSPQHVWVSGPQTPLFIRALQRRGLIVQSEASAHCYNFVPDPILSPVVGDKIGGQNRKPPASSHSAEQMHLLLAAHVMQALAKDLDLPTPLDPPTLTALASRLPSAQQRRLERALRLQLEHLRRHLPEPRAPALSPHPAPDASVEQGISAAIEHGQALQLHYQPPPPRPLITRPVVPLRLEPWGLHTYLLAYDLTRHDVRTFRFDRIVQVASLEKKEG